MKKRFLAPILSLLVLLPLIAAPATIPPTIPTIEIDSLIPIKTATFSIDGRRVVTKSGLLFPLGNDGRYHVGFSGPLSRGQHQLRIDIVNSLEEKSTHTELVLGPYTQRPRPSSSGYVPDLAPSGQWVFDYIYPAYYNSTKKGWCWISVYFWSSNPSATMEENGVNCAT